MFQTFLCINMPTCSLHCVSLTRPCTLSLYLPYFFPLLSSLNIRKLIIRKSILAGGVRLISLALKYSALLMEIEENVQLTCAKGAGTTVC